LPPDGLRGIEGAVVEPSANSSDQEEEPVRYAVRFNERAARDLEAAYVRFGELSSEAIANEWRDGFLDATARRAFAPAAVQ
jgi:hypothetical protein